MHGHEKEYEVSNLGNIRSFPRVKIRSNGLPHTIRPKILKPATDKKGYQRIAISSNGKLITKKVHREVLKAHAPNSNMNKLTVNHKDGDKKNNCLENLEWMTFRENSLHSWGSGLQENSKRKAAERAKERRKLTDDQVIECRNKYRNGSTIRGLAKEFNIDHKTMSHIVKGITYREVKFPEN